MQSLSPDGPRISRAARLMVMMTKLLPLMRPDGLMVQSLVQNFDWSMGMPGVGNASFVAFKSLVWGHIFAHVITIITFGTKKLPWVHTRQEILGT